MSLRRLFRVTLFSSLIAISFSACSVSADYSKANAATTRFHELVDRSESGAIYDASSLAFQQSISRDQWAGFLSRMKRKMGTCADSVPGWQAFQVTISGTFVTTNDSRKCANGKLGEQFVWKSAGGEVKLVKYVASNPLLMTD